MPELPEAEHARARLSKWLRGRRLTDAGAYDRLVVRTPSGAAMGPPAFRAALVGARVRGARRRAKRIVLDLDGGRALGLTLGMSGRPELARGASASERATLPPHARWAIAAGERVVALVDPRRLSRVTVGAREEVERFLGFPSLGPEPSELRSAAALAARFDGARGPVQAALMDQRRLGGLGNIHAAEALFLARIRPTRPASSLGPREWSALRSGIDRALRRAAIPPSQDLRYASEGGPSPFLVYGRDGEPCPRCEAPIVRARAGGRSWYYCPRCQPARGTERGKTRR